MPEQLKAIKPTFDQAMRDMISAHDDLILDLKKQLAGQEKKASALEEKLKIANEEIKELEKYSATYEYEETINCWEIFYSAENFLVQQLMETVIKHANIKGIVNTLDKLNL